jgi:hypothetical protein
MLAEERRPSLLGVAPLVGLLGIVIMPLLLFGWWWVLGGVVWYGPFVLVAGTGVVLLFVDGRRALGIALMTVAASWFVLLLWFLSTLEGID